MGCLNSEEGFDHWFGNIHLSGPCNRSCYFCIGQHMMALDPLNNLDQWPLKGLHKFIYECQRNAVKEINLTGSNTDPLLYQHIQDLREYLRERISGLIFGVRTNGVLALQFPERWAQFDKASISVTSLDPELYAQTMGQGEPPDLAQLINPSDLPILKQMPIKANVVLCPETIRGGDIFKTLAGLAELGFKMINLREPYGQPHIGNPFKKWGYAPVSNVHGMPTYDVDGTTVVYWDVHYVEVESVNLYANGNVSVDYPITRGHSREFGSVYSQEEFPKSGRAREQWRMVIRNGEIA